MATKDITAKCIAVANYLIEKTGEYNKGKGSCETIFLSVGRLQRLLYFVQIENMRRTGKSMFEDDFYAWPHGPAIERLYDIIIDLNLKQPILYRENENEVALTQEEKDVIDYVFNKTKNIEKEDLEMISRVEGTPWHHNYKPNDINHLQIIPKTVIFDYYVIGCFINKDIKFSDLTQKCILVTRYLIDKINKYNEETKKSKVNSVSDVPKLQHILYFIQIENMIRTQLPMFADDFYAWRNGPVIPRLYDIDIQDYSFKMNNIIDKMIVTQEEKDVIDYIFDKTKTMSCLEEISCGEGTPWHKSYNPNVPNHEQIISKTSIYEYYVGDEKSKQRIKSLF